MNAPDESVTAAIQNLRRPKHGARTLRWRQKNRAARRERLSNTWSRAVMATGIHQVSAMWLGFWAKRAPEIAGQVPRLHTGLPGWKSFKKQARAAVRS